MLNIATANVLVLMPPPVDSGAQPIHISISIIMIVCGPSSPRSTVLNPAVRAVVDKKNDSKIRSTADISICE